jgi:hypothetical protein
MFNKIIKNTIDILSGKKSKWSSTSCIILALITSFIISIIYYNKNYDENNDKNPIFKSSILFFLVFITINMLTRNAGITL